MFGDGTKRLGLQKNQEQSQTHRQLRENIVEGDRESEVQTVNVNGLPHASGFLVLVSPTVARPPGRRKGELRLFATLAFRAIPLQAETVSSRQEQKSAHRELNNGEAGEVRTPDPRFLNVSTHTPFHLFCSLQR